MKSFNFVVEVLLVLIEGELVERYIVRDVNGHPVTLCNDIQGLGAYIHDQVTKFKDLPEPEEASK